MEQEVKKEKLPKKYKIVGFAMILPISILSAILCIFSIWHTLMILTFLSIFLCTYFASIGQWRTVQKVKNITERKYKVSITILTFIKIIPWLIIGSFWVSGLVVDFKYQDKNKFLVLADCAIMLLLLAIVAFILWNDYRRYYKKLKNKK